MARRSQPYTGVEIFSVKRGTTEQRLGGKCVWTERAPVVAESLEGFRRKREDGRARAWCGHGCIHDLLPCDSIAPHIVA